MPKISTFPNWTTNPYLNILYLEVQSEGWEISGGTSYADLLKAVKVLGTEDILHIQWTSPFEAGVKSRADYQRRIREFVKQVEAARSRGVKLIWTVHNLIAHQTNYFHEEVTLAKELSRLADRIIILNSRTPDVAKDFYELPTEKVRCLPHSSYEGIYPPPLSRSEVEEVLGIPQGFRTIGAIGAVRPYKGTGDFLLGASIAARNLGNSALLLAGATSHWAMKQVDQFIPRDIPVFRKHTQLDDTEMGQWMSACDVMVLPYQGILNSGSMHLAATFGVPVVLPALPHLIDEYPNEDWINFFQVTEDPDENLAGISAAIERAVINLPFQKRAARKFSEKYTPLDMTRGFSKIISEL